MVWFFLGRNNIFATKIFWSLSSHTPSIQFWFLFWSFPNTLRKFQPDHKLFPRYNILFILITRVHTVSFFYFVSSPMEITQNCLIPIKDKNFSVLVSSSKQKIWSCLAPSLKHWTYFPLVISEILQICYFDLVKMLFFLFQLLLPLEYFLVL